MGLFVWACRALNSQKRRFPARAVLGGVIGQAAREIERIGAGYSSHGG